MGGCATLFGASSDELDVAIRDTTNYLNNNIPRGSKIVFLNIQSDYPALSDYIIDELISNTVNDRLFTVVSRLQLDAIRAEFNIQSSAEIDNNRAIEVGQYFGAQTIISGRFMAVGDRFRLTVNALETQTARVQGQYNRNMASSETIIVLMGADLRISSPAPGNRPATVAPVTTPAATPPATASTTLRQGTYTFWPRVTATMNGIPINDAFIDKIVINNRNMLIYITAVNRGASNNGPRGHNTAAGFKCILTNVNRPSQSWQNIGAASNPEGGVIISFENVTANRLTLETEYWNGTVIFDEFTLGQPD